MEIYIIEIDKRKFKYLSAYFSNYNDVHLVNESFESFMKKNKDAIECVVSPGNSFGLMDGGYDLALTEWYGKQLQERVQEYIINNYYGEQGVGTSFIIPTNKDNQFLIHTPTMRTPQEIIDPRIIYQCMRSTLIEAINNKVKSILIPMFGASIGNVKPQVVSEMMFKAYTQIKNPPKNINWDYVETIEMLPISDFQQNDEHTNY